jgi:hypothetical protein
MFLGEGVFLDFFGRGSVYERAGGLLIFVFFLLLHAVFPSSSFHDGIPTVGSFVVVACLLAG